LHEIVKTLITSIRDDLGANSLIVGDTEITTIYREYDRKPNDEHITLKVDYDNYYDTTQKAFKPHSTIHYDMYCNNEIKCIRVRDAFIDRFSHKYGVTQLRHNLGVVRLDNGKFVCRCSGKIFASEC